MNELEKLKLSQEEPLRGCPFCGCEAIKLRTFDGVGHCYVCDGCQAQGGFSFNKNIARWAWQKRTLPKKDKKW